MIFRFTFCFRRPRYRVFRYRKLRHHRHIVYVGIGVFAYAAVSLIAKMPCIALFSVPAYCRLAPGCWIPPRKNLKMHGYLLPLLPFLRPTEYTDFPAHTAAASIFSPTPVSSFLCGVALRLNKRGGWLTTCLLGVNIPAKRWSNYFCCNVRFSLHCIL